MFGSDSLSNLRLRFRSKDSARLRRRRTDRRTQLGAGLLRLEERCMLSGGVINVNDIPPSQLMTANVSNLSDVVFVGGGPHNLPAPPQKLITIYNHSSQTIYPMLEDGNTAGAVYDPQDPANHEFRGYIGYDMGTDASNNEVDVVGLPKDTAITISVPLVFWNAGTLQIFTSPDILVNDNTFTYHGGDGSLRYIQKAVGENTTGRILWYQAVNGAANTNQNTSPDAPNQLTEFTIRDKNLATWAPNSPPDQRLTLINYDVSYVQDMLLPVAMAAENVPIPRTNETATFGWVGANMAVSTMQNFISAFTTNAPAGQPQSLLGWYYNGMGSDQYYLPNPASTGIKIPANDRTFGLSPLGDVTSTYDGTKFQLVSGGTAFQVTSTGAMAANSHTITGLDASVVSQLKVGMLVKPSIAPGNLAQDTTITGFGSDGTSVTVNNVPKSPISTTFAFVGSILPGSTTPGPISDYVVSTLARLWYSWADYYATQAGLPKIKYSDQVNAPKLDFTTNKAQADAFAKVVYTVMNAFSKIAPNDIYLPAYVQLMQNVIGCNTGFIKGITPAEERQLTIDVQSLLRGVPNWTVDSTWYPNPADATKGAAVGGIPAKFNLYNLDPFVWFVHKKLKLSGYGFSVDDDVADVGAGDASKLLISVGGVNSGAPLNMNPNEWFTTLPWGAITTDATVTKVGAGGGVYKNDYMITFKGADATKFFNQINNPGPGQTGAYIYAPGVIPRGTTLIFKGPHGLDKPEIVLQVAKGMKIKPRDKAIPVMITGALT
jgi:hypothetical protein